MNTMLSVFVIITLWYTLTFKPSSANFPCTVYESSRSGSNDDDIATISCSTTYPTMVSCGCRTHWPTEAEMDGCHQNSDATICTARNGKNGDGVYAVARCCKFPTNDVECVGIESGFTDGDASVSITCGQTSHQYLTGCSAFSLWSAIDGCYPNQRDPFAVAPVPNSNYVMDGYCTAHNGGSLGAGKGTSAQAVCCHSPTYALHCVLRYGNQTTGPGQVSLASCGAGYTMTGCSGFGAYRNINAWYVSYQTDICRARTYADREIQAVAICCRMETDAPTTDPTKEPTPAPTSSPTPQPTKNPSKMPTLSPTKLPTKPPTKTPTNILTINPSTNPTKSPTNNPSIFATATTSPTIIVAVIICILMSLLLIVCVLIYLRMRKNGQKHDDPVDIEMAGLPKLPSLPKMNTYTLTPPGLAEQDSLNVEGDDNNLEVIHVNEYNVYDNKMVVDTRNGKDDMEDIDDVQCIELEKTQSALNEDMYENLEELKYTPRTVEAEGEDFEDVNNVNVTQII